ncbi:chemotaxis protein CheA [Paraburkholderia sp. ZP32-5]|uniref:chemotaxis protein CheA n=1 Tax=Paraburkholderia sp. ZP32-5 TaxID=2883245 RepID=UPI001F39AA31|nr:chemotaxis protein CheA [Paraburkholderia sp. ZP32-5]
MNLDHALTTFIAESRDLLENMESALLSLGENPRDGEAVNAIFRAAHTIKGSAGLFGLDHIVGITHLLESVLDEMRGGRVAVDAGMMVLLLACGDHIASLITALEQGRHGNDTESVQRAQQLMAQLHGYLGQRGAPAAATVTTVTIVDSTAADPAGDTAEDTAGNVPREPGIGHWHISLRFGASVLRNGLDPLSLLRYLGTLGEFAAVVTMSDAMPVAADMDPELCYLGFEIAFRSDADRATIEGAFEFVIDDCEVRILAPDSSPRDCAQLLSELGTDPVRAGEMLVRCGTLDTAQLDAVLRDVMGATHSVSAAHPLAMAAAQTEPAPPSPPHTAPRTQMAAPLTPTAAQMLRAKEAAERQSLRVDAQRLDQLIDLLGELTIAAAGTALTARRSRNAELEECTATLTALVREVRDAALHLRMVRIGATFNRFQRVVHDLSHEMGKDIALVVNGEDTELDKTLVEKLADPLTHMVRNAIDHGIEMPAERLRAGKHSRGTVTLNAYHDSGSVVIEVSDDGAGMNRKKILAKAVERGLVSADAKLPEREVFELIFEPGFSTADHVTSLSGRGVGMDVVRRNITALRGSIAIDSKPGIGTRMTVRLPLTLAIIDGFMVEVDDAAFVIPLEMVDECIEFNDKAGRDYTNLRGNVLPLIRLREFFALDSTPTRRQSVVVIKHGELRAGLVVDGLVGELQTVIKPLSPVFSRVRCISGSTILGSGDVALIIDVPALFSSICGGNVRADVTGASPISWKAARQPAHEHAPHID